MKILYKFYILLFSVFASLITYAGSNARLYSSVEVANKKIKVINFNEFERDMVIFSCNPFSYVIAYENRLIDLQNKYASQGIPLVLINTNDAVKQYVESMYEMRVRAEKKNYPFTYLKESD